MVSLDRDTVSAALVRADSVIEHRGPDGVGSCIEQWGPWNIGLGHRRLSIIDLSPAGKQPMTHDGHVVAYNGELFNYKEIRAEIGARAGPFRSESDTEVLLKALSLWGEDALRKFNGMWGIAWIDRARRRLVLARDRLGVKPLYVQQSGNTLFFASEIKAILEMSGGQFALDAQVVGEYAVQSLLETSTRTFFSGITKVPAGSILEVDLSGERPIVSTRAFWTLSAAERPVSEAEGVEMVRELLIDAVRLRLRSDVPVGVLLSGGVDSSAIAACMQRILGPDANLNLLSAVSDGGRFDESPFIDIVAAHLRRPVHKVKLDLDSKRALELLSQVSWYNDEPVGSFANVAHFLLMERAREHGITVILSGQGADEIFCGYRKFLGFHMQTLLRSGRVLEAVRDLGGFFVNRTVVTQFSFQEARRYLPGMFSSMRLSVAGEALEGFVPVAAGLPSGASLRERQIADLTRFSVPILTHYEDRMSMAWSREVRTPFLDYRLVEAAIALPVRLKLAHGWTKYALRKAMEPLLPAAIAWRKDKQNFVNPQSEWLKTDLRPAVLGIFRDPSSLIFRYRLLAQPGLIALYERYCRQPVDRGAVSFKQIFQPLALELWLRSYSRFLAEPVKVAA